MKRTDEIRASNQENFARIWKAVNVTLPRDTRVAELENTLYLLDRCAALEKALEMHMTLHTVETSECNEHKKLLAEGE